MNCRSSRSPAEIIKTKFVPGQEFWSSFLRCSLSDLQVIFSIPFDSIPGLVPILLEIKFRFGFVIFLFIDFLQ